MIYYSMRVKNLENEKPLPAAAAADSRQQTAGWGWAVASQGPGPLWPLPGTAETRLREGARGKRSISAVLPAVPAGIQTSP